jgi:hypothetical protein
MNKSDPIKGPPTIEGMEVRIEDGWRIEKPIQKEDRVISGSPEQKDIKKSLNNLRGKYAKRLLSQLEPLDVVDIVVRKIILDAINDYARDINTTLGYE